MTWQILGPASRDGFREAVRLLVGSPAAGVFWIQQLLVKVYWHPAELCVLGDATQVLTPAFWSVWRAPDAAQQKVQDNMDEDGTKASAVHL